MGTQSDTWWLLRTGELILRTGQFRPPISIARPCAAATGKIAQWLAEVLFYACYALGGLPLLFLACAGLTTAAWYGMVRLGEGPGWARAVALLIGLASQAADLERATASLAGAAGAGAAAPAGAAPALALPAGVPALGEPARRCGIAACCLGLSAWWRCVRRAGGMRSAAATATTDMRASAFDHWRSGVFGQRALAVRAGGEWPGDAGESPWRWPVELYSGIVWRSDASPILSEWQPPHLKLADELSVLCSDGTGRVGCRLVA